MSNSAALAIRAPDQTEDIHVILAENTALRLEVARLNALVMDAEVRARTAESLADRDGLVPVKNRRGFLRELTRVMAEVARYGGEAALVYFDLDGFKAINDRRGHHAGDLVLQQVGRVLLANTRDSDVVGRLGGDEFAVILTHISGDAARRKAASLSKAIEDAPVAEDGYILAIAASYGVHDLTIVEDPEIAIARADEAMYAEKWARKRARQG